MNIYWGGGGGGGLMKFPLHTPNSAVISILSTPSDMTTSTKTTFIAVLGVISVWVLPVVSVSAIPITTIWLSSVESPVASYIELLLPCWVKFDPAITDGSDEILPYLPPKMQVWSQA